MFRISALVSAKSRIGMEGIEPSILRPEHSVIPLYHIPKSPGYRGQAFSRARKLAGKSVSSSSTNGKTALKKAPHVNVCVQGSDGNLTTFSIRLRSLERRLLGKPTRSEAPLPQGLGEVPAEAGTGSQPRGFRKAKDLAGWL